MSEEEILKLINDARANFSWSGGVSYEEEIVYLLRSKTDLQKAISLVEDKLKAVKQGLIDSEKIDP